MNTEILFANKEICQPTIDWYENKKKNNEYSEWCTHQPILYQLLQLTNGDILELGLGNYSTPLISLFTSDKRIAYSYDTEQSWVEKFKPSKNHKILLQKDFTKTEWHLPYLTNKEWGLAFVDNAPGESRASNIFKLRNNAQIVLVHDSQEAGYKYEPVFNLYKYRTRFKDFSTTTEILSNFVDVTKLPIIYKPTL